MIGMLEILDERVQWKGRKAQYFQGPIERLLEQVPRFEMRDFKAESDTPANPHYLTVVRLPLTAAEKPVPVGVVSKSYTLLQHRELIQRCIEALTSCGIDSRECRFEFALTELGEWMNFRVVFPKEYAWDPGDSEPVGLRLECFNTVEGSARLTILLVWIRFICTNGLIFGETRFEFSDTHDRFHGRLGPVTIACTGAQGNRERAGKNGALV